MGLYHPLFLSSRNFSWALSKSRSEGKTPVSITFMPSSGGRIPNSIIRVMTRWTWFSSFISMSSKRAVGASLNPRFLQSCLISGCKNSFKKASRDSRKRCKKSWALMVAFANFSSPRITFCSPSLISLFTTSYLPGPITFSRSGIINSAFVV